MSTALTFLSLFLGLTTGVQPVALAVDGAPARVEVRLDGASCGERTRPPWSFTCDFGDELAPHRLEAVAYDAEGGELSRELQLVNLAPRQAEAEIVLLRDEEGRAEALRLVWESVRQAEPLAAYVRFDDEPLPVTDPRRVPLPDHDPAGVHFATAELVFPDGTTARSELVFGAGFGDSVSSRNTAVPLVAGDAGDLRRRLATSGALTAGGRVLRTLAVEGGEVDVVAVVEGSARPELDALRDAFRQPAGRGRRGTGLEPGDRFTLVQPVARPVRHGTGTYELFTTSPPRPASEGGLAWQLTHVTFPPVAGTLRLADAVATAAMQATAGGRPRAVLLVLGPRARDDSAHAVAEVRRFLERLRVPLAVWWVEREAKALRAGESRPSASEREERRLRRRRFEAAWGGLEEVGSFHALLKASRRLRSQLAHQRVVWVEGIHLPHEIAVAPSVAGVEPAGGVLTAPTGGAAEDRLASAAPVEGAAAAGAEPASRTPGVDRGDPQAAGPATGGGAEPRSGGPVLLASAVDRETFRDAVSVELVEVEVTVTDRRGHRVTALAAEDFQVLEDGRPVEISHFARVGMDSETTEIEAPAPPAEPPADASPAPASPAPSPRPTTAEPVFVTVFLDNAHMGPEERNRALERLAPFLARELPAGTRVQLVVRDEGLRVRQPFTGDPEAVLAAARSAAGGTASGNRRAQERRRAVEQIQRMGNLHDAIRAADAYASQRELEVRRTVTDLGNLVDALAPLPGRKVLLYLGSDLPVIPGREAFLVADRLYGESGDAGGGRSKPRTRGDRVQLWMARHDAAPLYRELAERANAGRVTFYTLDPAGLRPPTTAGVEQRAWTPLVGLDAELADNAARSLHLLASATGGRAITGADRIEPELDLMAGDLSSYYSLGYTPDPRGVGETHRLEVRVDRPGVEVRHRRAYRHRPPEERLRDAVLAALEAAPAANPMRLELDFGRGEAVAPEAVRMPLRLHVPFESMVLVPSGGLWVNRWELFVAAADAGGGRSEVRRAEVPVELPEGRAAGLRGTYTVTVPLRLSPGPNRVALGLRDTLTGEESVVTGTVEVPRPGPEALRAAGDPRDEPEDPLRGTRLASRAAPPALPGAELLVYGTIGGSTVHLHPASVHHGLAAADRSRGSAEPPPPPGARAWTRVQRLPGRAGGR